MKVYLLKIEPDGRRLFFADPVVDDGSQPLPQHKGLRGWLEIKFRRFKIGWQDSESRAIRFMREVWEWLQKHTHPDEHLLARLRSSPSIDVHHPASMTSEEVLAAWSEYLGKARKRHWPWFLVNLIVSPLTVLLAPIPGPNLIGYWIAYRAVHHWLILLGLGHARRGRIETHLKAEAALDRPVNITAKDATPVSDALALNEFLRRHGARLS